MFFLLILTMFGANEETHSVGELVQKGMTAYTEKDYRRAIEYFKTAFEKESTYSALAYNIACCYSLLNLKDSALIWLKKAIELGTYEFEKDPDFDNIRDLTEFQQLVNKAAKLLEEAKKKEWESLVFTPEDYDTSKKYPLFIALHGFGTSPKDFTRKLHRIVTQMGYIFLCPYGTEIHGISSFSWGEIEKTEKKVIQEIEKVKKDYSIDEKNVILLGYSQGGTRAFSIGLRNPQIFKGLIIVAGYFKEEEVRKYLPNLKDKKLRVFVMVGEKDEVVKESNKKAKELIEEYGAKVHLEIYPEVGHAFPGDPEKEIEKALEFIGR